MLQAGMVELADTRDLKSRSSNRVGVQVPLSAFKTKMHQQINLDHYYHTSDKH